MMTDPTNLQVETLENIRTDKISTIDRIFSADGISTIGLAGVCTTGSNDDKLPDPTNPSEHHFQYHFQYHAQKVIHTEAGRV